MHWVMTEIENQFRGYHSKIMTSEKQLQNTSYCKSLGSIGFNLTVKTLHLAFNVFLMARISFPVRNIFFQVVY